MRSGFGLICSLQRALKLFQARSLVAAAILALGAAATGAPLPPPRPPEFGVPEPVKTAPQIPSVEPVTPQPTQPPASGGREPADVDVSKLRPYNLPPASREKMHQCGDEWRKLKMAGKSVGLVWRSFAEKCLVR